MKEELTVVKIGGNVIDEESTLKEFISVFSQLPGKKLLVHGGGKIATKIATSLGAETRMINGRRITDDKMIDVVVMVYGGLINKKIVSLLSKEKEKSMGLTGADGNCILAEKRPIVDGVDYGWVGDIKAVDAGFFRALLEAGIIPVLCALTHDGQGHLLNTNADTIAGEVAVALSPSYNVALSYCFEWRGVLKDVDDPNSLIKRIDAKLYEKLKADGIVSAGMIPKLDNAFAAIKRGVAKVNILNLESFPYLNDRNYEGYTKLH
ncbi:MAG: acetylglutamate kinase [Bacteroidota bacterium]